MKVPIGSDAHYSPPMDVPPYAWMTYYRDARGRQSFVPSDCLGSSDPTFARHCVQQAIEDHDRQVAAHRAESERVGAERKQQEVAARASEEAKLQNERHDEQSRQAKVEADANAVDRREEAAAGRVENNPATDMAGANTNYSTATDSANDAATGGATTSSSSGLIVIIIILAIYFLPTVVAAVRSHRNGGAIFLLNLLLGWTVLGWVLSLVWSMTDNTKART